MGTYEKSHIVNWLLVDNDKKEFKAIYSILKVDDDGERRMKRLPEVVAKSELFAKFYGLALNILPNDMLLGDLIHIFLIYAAHKANESFPLPEIAPELITLMEELFETKDIKEK